MQERYLAPPSSQMFHLAEASRPESESTLSPPPSPVFRDVSTSSACGSDDEGGMKFKVKHTFLQFDIPDDAEDFDLCDSPLRSPRRCRSQSDTLIAYGSDSEGDVPQETHFIATWDEFESPDYNAQGVDFNLVDLFDKQEADPVERQQPSVQGRNAASNVSPTEEQHRLFDELCSSVSKALETGALAGTPVSKQSLPAGVNGACVMTCIGPFYLQSGPASPNQTYSSPNALSPLVAQAQLDAASGQLAATARSVKAAASAARRLEQPNGLKKRCQKSRQQIATSSNESARRSESEQIDMRSTVMLRHLPNNIPRDMLLALMDSAGFKGCYDFVYMPMDFLKDVSFRYAFVNLVTHEVALRFHRHFQGFSAWPLPCSTKVCDVAWSGPHQGLAAHIERFRSSPVMHEDVPEKYRPVVFSAGVRVEFPASLKRVRRPRMRHPGAGALVGSLIDSNADGLEAEDRAAIVVEPSPRGPKPEAEEACLMQYF